MSALSTHLPNAAHPPSGAAQTLVLHGTDSPSRRAVEAFIAEVYRTRFGAEIRHFAPALVGLHDPGGRLVAAAGYRRAADGPLFLERYLDATVDQRLCVPRGTVVEVGHLAAAEPGAGRRLIARMAPHLAAQGQQWVVSTLTEELRHLFMRLGIVPQALGIADPALLGDEAAAWGRYYDHRPVVGAGAIGPALQTLARRRERLA
ncbi:MAG: thermostable hemolysin [Burkholderiaceae bacterium]|nr:thermostable hemolysin [Burkholderiaceae bacterium]